MVPNIHCHGVWQNFCHKISLHGLFNDTDSIKTVWCQCASKYDRSVYDFIYFISSVIDLQELIYIQFSQL
jgi:hypothetical protein